MSQELEIGTKTLNSPSKTIDLRFRQEPEMGTPMIETSANEFTLSSVDEQIKQATDPILGRKEEFCVLLPCWTEMESTENSEKSGSRCYH